ncbi:small nuclear ribonucleoprotein SmD3a isoform X3 [Vigna angularis]|uniref:small nuclear ribonucleoprotein SmD3a isoform X3 n=1 Tax=Phaseolus angularis TaxID=3914 RepID=UPI0022B5D418|nr:small nuclear ribonucleoprotein SmD3a isoform X3 [Vigna angularis]
MVAPGTYLGDRWMENHHNLSMYLFETAKSGQVYRFIVIPDMLKNAPMFKRLDARIKGKGASLGVGRGRAVAIRAKAQAAGRGVAPGRGVPPVRR